MSLHLKSLELNNKVLENIQITSQENMILKSMENFYTHDININLFLNIISVESSISIRLIDYFVTKYSKLHKISYKYNDETINVYTSYKQQLKAFQKKHFDPFSRGERIPYFMSDTCIITTIGQLNFFRWFISKNILEYIVTNHVVIDYNMNYRNKDEKIITRIHKKIKQSAPIIKPHINNDRVKNTKIIVYFN
jgi:hypothetical protein